MLIVNGELREFVLRPLVTLLDKLLLSREQGQAGVTESHVLVHRAWGGEGAGTRELYNITMGEDGNYTGGTKQGRFVHIDTRASCDDATMSFTIVPVCRWEKYQPPSRSSKILP